MSKAEKEAAVYGHQGTTLFEIAAIVATLPFLLSASPSRSFLEDILNIALPLLLAVTIAADYLPGGVLAIPAVCIIAKLWHRNEPYSNQVRERPSENQKDNYMFAILRGSTVLLTVVCILAVDFPAAFPRRYVKTEWYGTGLMDIGVGAYVFTGAIVRGSKLRRMSVRETLTTLFVGCMGFLRAFANKAVDYQEHVSEYGVHWNFFVTLIMVKIFGDFFSRFIARGSSLLHFISGATLLLLHQYFLSGTVLGKWAMEDATTLARKQHSLAWQNKEGLISLTGYIALDLCTKGSAEWLLKQSQATLFYLSVGLWALLVVVRSTIEDVARRSANAAYVIWMFAIGVLLLWLSSALVLPDYNRYGKRSVMITMFSHHQLLIFIISNLITGAVNLSMNTLVVPVWEAEGILAIYTIVVCGIAYALEIAFTWNGRRQKANSNNNSKAAAAGVVVKTD